MRRRIQQSPGWHPSFYHQQGTHHGYHHYVYNGHVKMIAYRGGVRFYDLDRMRYTDRRLTNVGTGSTGLMVAMNGDSRLLTVPAYYYRGGPFRVRQANFEEMTLEPIEGSDVPFASNDRAKVVFDTNRQRILYYGARSGENRVCNELWAFPLETGKWEKIEIRLSGGGTAPQIGNWDYGYSAKHDCLVVGSKGTWILDLKTRTMKQVSEKASGPGIVYSPHQDLFCTLHGGGYKMQEVYVFRYVPEK